MSYIPFPDISPELFSIELFGMTFALRWYALAYIAGLVIGWRLVLRMIRAERLWTFGPPMTEDQLERLLSWVILGVILGGRLGFVLFYQPAHYLAHPLDILKVWEGGMSFHGGFLGVMTALVAFCLKERISILPVADLLAAATPPGLFLGRIANFINAELWGRPTTLPWGVAFPGEAAQNCPGIEGICARHPSQLYEAGLEGILLFTVLSLLVWRRGWLHWPGSVSGMFLAGYGATRFLVEFVRQPDAQFVSAGNPLGLAWQISGYGLTMGQILSLPMILLGLYLILRSRRAA
ncbi:prolipoprotein diacylglyceryl transferase [Cereibacter johrii]|uniref:prolipoprotein diacylglyceryl transferase n=1 Tax=Cereibacter johrii TaxID=445629 RepID=UPI000C6E2ABF|nr:prolipoprotein diacylglyceryl transferase [Cereibacter johrii]QCP84269.1 prolipoprotein diacylglyceryl transferase [Cereibacter sphaeroides]RAZ81898.1 prolipoprotein diacylglyceryl transferase [Cereibacter johrii]RDS95249.1 prolipoprotein diacylglyceryl transferase [Cereibacter sphaeroides f. sp. denitrificans]